MDVERAFDSLDHSFLISVLKKFGFGKNFITWIEILLKDQQSCVINGGTTTQCFNLERGAPQGDPVSAYLFILVLEILFLFIKKHPEIKGIEIFEHCFLYTAYGEDTTFFLKDAQSIENLVEIFSTISLFSGLKPNLTKCEIAGIGALKGVQVAVCGMRCIDLCNEAIKILGTYFSCNSKIKEECNFLNPLSAIVPKWSNKLPTNCLSVFDHFGGLALQGLRLFPRVLNLWQYGNLTLEGRIVVFKSLAVSKIVFEALIALGLLYLHDRLYCIFTLKIVG